MSTEGTYALAKHGAFRCAYDLKPLAARVLGLASVADLPTLPQSREMQTRAAKALEDYSLWYRTALCPDGNSFYKLWVVPAQHIYIYI